jgi:type IV pilus assembly protein PilW
MCMWLPLREIDMNSSNRERGVSLVEMMVAVVIGMLTILAVTQSMYFFETMRRGTTTGADAQSNAAFSVYMMERDLRMAGYGVFANHAGFINNCIGGSVVAYNSERSPTDMTFAVDDVPFFPVSINPPGIPAGDPNTDVVGVAFSASDIGVSAEGTLLGTDNGAGNIAVGNTGGISAGDLALAVPTAAGTACSIYEITDGPGAVACNGAGTAATLVYGEADYQSRRASCANVTPTRNKSGGLGVVTANYTNGRLFNLGHRNALSHVYYAVRSGRLVRCNHQVNNCAGNENDTLIWEPVSDGVVMLRAEFGIASGGQNSAVDTWRTGICDAGGCTPTQDDWANLRVIRIAVVARSQQSGGADTTLAAPQWNGQEAISLDGTVDEWQRYRYSTTEVVIPLRNIVWGMSS